MRNKSVPWRWLVVSCCRIHSWMVFCKDHPVHLSNWAGCVRESIRASWISQRPPTYEPNDLCVCGTLRKICAYCSISTRPGNAEATLKKERKRNKRLMQFILCNVSKTNDMETKVTCSHSDRDAILECSACMSFIIGFKWPESDTSPTSSQLFLVAKSDK